MPPPRNSLPALKFELSEIANDNNINTSSTPNESNCESKLTPKPKSSPPLPPTPHPHPRRADPLIQIDDNDLFPAPHSRETEIMSRPTPIPTSRPPPSNLQAPNSKPLLPGHTLPSPFANYSEHLLREFVTSSSPPSPASSSSPSRSSSPPNKKGKQKASSSPSPPFYEDDYEVKQEKNGETMKKMKIVSPLSMLEEIVNEEFKKVKRMSDFYGPGAER